MNIQIDIAEAQTRLPDLIALIQSGDDVAITREGKPAVRLVAIRPERKPGRAKGMIEFKPGWDDPIPFEIFEAIEGKNN